jgi:hypothetical protein
VRIAFENVSDVVIASRPSVVKPPNQTAVRRTRRVFVSLRSASGKSASNGITMMSFDGALASATRPSIVSGYTALQGKSASQSPHRRFAALAGINNGH